MSLVILAYDLVAIPLQFFEQPENRTQTIVNLVTTSLWTADIFVSFFNGYHVGGLIEMRPSQAALHYLRTWFPIDITVVTVDWVVIYTLGVSDSVSLFRLNKTLRIMRILRLLRLLRVLKGLNLVSDLSDKIQSEEVRRMFWCECLDVCQYSCLFCLCLCLYSPLGSP